MIHQPLSTLCLPEFEHIRIGWIGHEVTVRTVVGKACQALLFWQRAQVASLAERLHIQHVARCSHQFEAPSGPRGPANLGKLGAKTGADGPHAGFQKDHDAFDRLAVLIHHQSPEIYPTILAVDQAMGTDPCRKRNSHQSATRHIATIKTLERRRRFTIPQFRDTRRR